MIDYLVVTAVASDFEALQLQFPSSRQERGEDGLVFFRAHLDTPTEGGPAPEVVLLLIGAVGRVPAAGAVAKAIMKWRPRSVLLVGGAAGVPSQVALGDILVADQIVDISNRKVGTDGDDQALQAYRTSPSLLAQARAVASGGWAAGISAQRPDNGTPSVQFGPIASSDAVVRSLKDLETVQRRFRGLLGIEMEGGGVAATVEAASPRPELLMIRGVADLAGPEKHDRWGGYAASVVATFVIALIEASRTGAAADGKPQLAAPAAASPEDNAPLPSPDTAESDLNVLFIVREYADPDPGPESEAQFPQVLLAHQRWDDFHYKITYHATLFTSSDAGFGLGNIKIFQPKGPAHDNILPERFTHLDATFCSLGSVSLYQRLLEHVELASEILGRLREVTILRPDEILEIISTRVFRRSAMREDDRERTWYELRQSVNPLREAMGLPPLQAVIADSEVPSTLQPDLSSTVDEPPPAEDTLANLDTLEESAPPAQGVAHADLLAAASASAASLGDVQPTAGSTSATSTPEPPSHPTLDLPAEPPPHEPQPPGNSTPLALPEQSSPPENEDEDAVDEPPARRRAADDDIQDSEFVEQSPPPSSDDRAKDEDSRLQFPEEWRFDASLTREVPSALCRELYNLVETIAKSAKSEWHIVGLFQDRFGGSGSSSLSFAYGDLDSAMQHRTANGALFVEYFWRGVCDAKRASAAAPSVENLNALFRKHQFPYELAPPDLRRTDTATPTKRSHQAEPASWPIRSPSDDTSVGAAPVGTDSSEFEMPDLERLLASDAQSATDAPDYNLHVLAAPASEEQSDPYAALDSLLGIVPTVVPSFPAPQHWPLVTPAPAPGSAEPRASVSWDSRTVTLTITAMSVRLDRGRQINDGAAPDWSRDVVLDWSQAQFVDESDHPCTLEQVLDRLPLQWSRPLVERFGQQLALLLFGDPIPAEVRGLLILPSGETRRLILVLDVEHQRIPWEYLRIGTHFLAEQQLSIVRHVETNSEPMPLVIEKPRTILFAYANPGGDVAVKYDGDAHKKKILDALDTFRATVTPAELCTAAGLEKLLCTGDGQVFHFLGHGVAGGTWDDASLVVHGKSGGYEPCPAEKIGLWMRDRRRSLAVLGACYGAAVPRAGLLSSVGGRIVHTSGTPVVAMQMEVPQAFSTAFVERFYRELPAADFNVEIAVFLARRAQCDERHLFGIPVLLTDARGLDKVADLRRPPGESPSWAQFVPVAALTSQDAVAAWSDLPADIARAAVAAIQKNAKRDPSARYPQPSDDPSQLPCRVAELRHAIRDPEARSSLAVASAAAPAPEPFALTSGVIEPLDELPLAHRLTIERCQAALKQVHADFSLPDGLVARIVGELRAGKHVMLTGPVGTGKTSIAQAIVRALGYDFHLDTASADWTRFEILGGFMPTPREDSSALHFTFRPGVFLEAVHANWSAEPKPGSARVTLWRRVRRPDGKEGVWLILDELNRADMDRALGGIFTALETRRLRVPASDRGTVEIPIPEDFRVIATMNAADRHFLFRLSDALKRRFAFVHVPVTVDWDGEWTRLRREARIPDETNADDLRRFVALVRMFHPLGSALVLAALRLYTTSDFHITADPEWPLTQAIEGALLPNLEDLSHAGLIALHTWSEAASVDRLAQSLLAALPQPSAVEPEYLAALAALPRELSQREDGDEHPSALDKVELVVAWIARCVARPPEAVPLPRLGRALLDLIRHAPHA